MFRELVKSYLNIFEFDSDDFQCVGLRKTSNTNSFDEIKLECLIEADTDLKDVVCPESICNRFRNKLKGKVSGPDIVEKIKLENENEKRAKFLYSIHLVPENVISFKIRDKKYQIKVLGYGLLE